MKNIFVFFLLVFLHFSCQKTKPDCFNLDFERLENNSSLPDDCTEWKNNYFNVQSVENMVYSGKKSILMKRIDNSVVTQNDFGAFSISFLGNYKGDSIKLEGYLKTENITNGFAGLFMRLDGENRGLQFDNMNESNINGTRSWKRYSITLPNNKKVKKITIGGLLTGTGKVWFDNFNITIDNKDICSLDTVLPIIPLAKLDDEFDSGSGIKNIDTSSQTVINLYKLGKVWGLCKYFHPVIAKEKKNWDYELFRMLPDFFNSPDANEKLYTWVNNIGSFDTNTNNIDFVSDPNFKSYLDITWISSDSLIQGNLSKLLKKINKSKKGKNHYYFDFEKIVGNPIFKNEETYDNIDFSDVGYRILCLYRYWNMIEYFYPNKHLIDKNWDSVLYEFIPKFIKVKNKLEYKLVVMELICNIQDTHADIYNDEDIETFFGNRISALETKFIENKLVIVDYYKQGINKFGLEKGNVIEKINGVNVEDIIKNMLPITHGSNYSTQLREIALRILRTNENNLNLQIRNGRIKTEIIVPTFPLNKIDQYSYKNIPPSKILEGNIGYIFPGTLKSDQIMDIMKSFEGTKGLVIDLRCYPSDFIVFSLGNYLVNKPMEFVKFSSTSYSHLGSFRYTVPQYVGDSTIQYNKKVAILVNEETQSSAEYTAMSFGVSPNSKIFGNQTAGADGNVSEIILPGGIMTYISGIGVYYPDGEETQRIGIDIESKITPKINDILSKKDVVIDQAINWINNN